ncbi:hypothetical protein IPdc08_00079 [archaeon]|nr:hypothetical protein IPdc08_00079 [archaeon]
MSPYSKIEMSPLGSYNVLQKGGEHYGREGHYRDEFGGIQKDKYNKSSVREADKPEESCRGDRIIIQANQKARGEVKRRRE